MQSLTTQWDGSAFPISSQAITDTINHTSGIGITTPRYRLLDRVTLKPVSLGSYGPLGDDGDISGYVSAGTATNDTSQDVQRSAQIVMLESASVPYNPLYHAIQMFVDYWSPTDGSLLFEVPVGIFVAAAPNRAIARAGIVSTLTMLDLSSDLVIPFLNTYTVPAGTNIIQAISTLLQISYLPLSAGGTGQTPAGLDMAGPNIPASRINLTPSTATFASDQICTPQQTILGQINTWLQSISYRPLWVDGMGVFRSDPIPDLSSTVPAPGWTYNTDSNSIIQEPITDQALNAADLGNICTVYVSNSSTAAFSAVAYNTNADSVLSLTRLRRAIPIAINDDTIPTQALAQLRANIALQAAAGLNEQLQFTTFVNPFHESHDSLSVTITDDNGATVVSSSIGWDETAWTIDPHGRTMSHTISRYVRIS